MDYVKNGRPDSADPDYVFSTIYAPYTRYHHTASLYRMVQRSMELVGINYEGRHHGSHSLRHSLASNMLSENVPISVISSVLGHASTKTTEICRIGCIEKKG
ncbi:MAG: tyrosine-type recombinase/integrase [Clostridiales bacterium]|nr:tyrosine-type recombinase/integrase [Clostridiales bacterium]